MENAFIGKAEKPTAADVSAVLGTSAGTWNQLVDELANDHGVSIQDWHSISIKYGWSLRLKAKKRTIVYLSPCKGCFQVAFALGDRAVEALLADKLSKTLAKVIHDAPQYAEGTGVRLLVKSNKDLSAIRKLVAAKLTN